MPRNVNPGSLRTGSGKSLPEQGDNLVLKDGSVADGIGVPGYIPLYGTLGTSRYGFPQPSSDGGMTTHLVDSQAHPATSVTVDSHPPLYQSSNVGGVLDELMGAVLPKLPGLGQFSGNYVGVYTGIPDWGPFKMKDQQFIATGDLTVPNPELVFPLYWSCPTPSQVSDPIIRTDGGSVFYPSVTVPESFLVKGEDPATDVLWNGAGSGTIGSGAAAGVAAAFTAGGGPSPIRRTRVFPAKRIGGVPHQWPVTVSGTIFPADRGVLALLHNIPGGDGVDFFSQDLLERCVAAVLLGQGLLNSNATLHDGDPGGVFTNGVNAAGYEDFFAYPGKASGQYDLDEIHKGVSAIDGSALPAPWDTTKKCVTGSSIPGAGQVRLGCDPGAGVAVKPYGIPVLGGGTGAYNPVPAAGPHYGPEIGASLIADSNFFRYRLPVLADYSAGTGLKYTPRGVDPYRARETSRYLSIAYPWEVGSVNSDVFEIDYAGSGEWFLMWAGNYRNFPEDYWTWQIARFRHSFQVLDSDMLGSELGSYWLVHFKTEADFEKCVRDGIMPWDATDPYEVYGANPVSTTVNWDDYQHRVNQVTGAGKDVAPTYGYQGPLYHDLRAEVRIGDETVLPVATVATSTWGIQASQIMYSSGIGYFTPINTFGDPGFWFEHVIGTVTGAWEDGYRFNEDTLTVGVAPAKLSSSNPVFLGLAQFSYETLMVGPTFYTNVGIECNQRAEYPFTSLDEGFTENVGPLAADTASINDQVSFRGDYSNPAFTSDGCPRMYVRRPLTDPPVQPYTALDGHGFRLEPTNEGGAKILYHSTLWNPTYTAAPYGNFVDPTSVPANQGYASLFNALKDVEERFLDEVYRYKSDWDVLIGFGAQTQLVGPGMVGWVGGDIIVPVQAGHALTMNWHHASWTWQLEHTVNQSASLELQVAGLPDRNPPLDDWAQQPFPSAGILMYPQKDYSVGYVPNAAQGGVAQPDYSGCVAERYYVRCFDVGFARSSVTNQTAIGQPYVTLQVTGLDFTLYKYNAPGPGDLGTSGVSIQVKVPGLTTWLDVGRPDGDGPSKQDAALDGAGCLVLGQYSFQALDPSTKQPYCQLKINVGAAANFFAGIIVGAAFEVPLLVKVVMNVNAIPINLEGTGPGNSSMTTYGLTTIRVLHPNNVQDASTVTGSILVG